MHLQSGDVPSAIEIYATIKETISLNTAEDHGWNYFLRNTFKVEVGLQSLSYIAKLVNRQMGLVDFG